MLSTDACEILLMGRDNDFRFLEVFLCRRWPFFGLFVLTGARKSTDKNANNRISLLPIPELLSDSHRVLSMMGVVAGEPIVWICRCDGSSNIAYSLFSLDLRIEILIACPASRYLLRD